MFARSAACIFLCRRCESEPQAENAKLKQQQLEDKAGAIARIVTAKKLSSKFVGRAREKSIPLEALNPDVNGDGKLSKDEAWLHQQLKSADKDGSGRTGCPGCGAMTVDKCIC